MRIENPLFGKGLRYMKLYICMFNLNLFTYVNDINQFKIYVQCPQQTTNAECGYYVMRFMKEIIENQADSIKKTWQLSPYPFKIYRFHKVDACINVDYFVHDIQFVGRDNFTQKDIDKVRVEWAEYIWQNIFR